MTMVSPLVEELEVGYDLDWPGQVVIMLTFLWAEPISVNVQQELVVSRMGVKWITAPFTLPSFGLVYTALPTGLRGKCTIIMDAYTSFSTK